MRGGLAKWQTAKPDYSRLVFDLSSGGVPEVPCFGWYRHASAQEGLAPHRHPGAVEICYLVRGRQVYRVGGRSYALTGGDFFVSQPGQSHDTGEMPQEKGVLYWLILDLPAPGAAFLGCDPEEAAAFRERLEALPRHFHGGAEMQRYFDALLAACREVAGGVLDRPLLRNRVVSLLLALFEVRERDERVSPLMRKVLATMEEGITEPVALEALARGCGLSLSRFKMRFRQEVGIPPAEYLLRRKVEHAADWLQRAPEVSITEVAYGLGFSSSQYFATVFKRYTGKPPSVFREPLNQSS